MGSSSRALVHGAEVLIMINRDANFFAPKGKPAGQMAGIARSYGRGGRHRQTDFMGALDKTIAVNCAGLKMKTTTVATREGYTRRGAEYHEVWAATTTPTR